MRKKRYFLACIATNLLVALTNQSAMGFTLKFGKGATSYYNPTAPYVLDANTRGTTFLSPRYVTPIKLGGTNDFLKMLDPDNDPRWRGWTFIPSDKNLYGNFEILRYYACGAQTLCAKEHPNPDNHIRGGVGAYIDIKYNPQKTDPKPGEGKIHWIQRVVNNHSLYDEQQSTSGGGVHGLRYDGIDIPIFQNANPYYRGGNEFSSFDRPYRTDPKNPHFWVGELYLVEEIAPKTVKIHNGVRWGWINRVYRRRQGNCPDIKSTSGSDTGDNCSYEFSDSLSSGAEVDSFNLVGLTPGKKFSAWIDNDIPGNRCNPNTYLTTSSGGSDDNSSPFGDGFGSALTGTVSNDGKINLSVSAANGGRRGEDRGSYKLYVEFPDESEFLPEVDEFVVGGSGGGGFGDETEFQGRTQNAPVFPDKTEQGGWQVFRDVPGCQWYDPTTSYGFEFQALDDTLFTEILDFPALGDNQFTVSVGDTVVGSKGPGQSLDFVSLLGQGVSNFKITGIDSKGPTEETAFPIQLAFNDRIGSFKMRPFSETFLDKTDDGSYGPFSFGFNLPFFGQNYNSFYVNNNGNISFGKPVGAYTSQSLKTQTLAPMIAPYWADVDTRGTGTVSVKTGIPNEVTVTWDKVGYYSQRTDKTASFQMILRGSDYPIPDGEGNLGFFYKDVQWETTGSSSIPAAIGFGDGLSGVNPGEYMFNGSQQPGISQLVKNKFYWFNLPTTSSSGCTSGCTQARARIASLRLPIFDSDETSQKPKSTPEPTSALGLIALLSWGIIRALKIRKS